MKKIYFLVLSSLFVLPAYSTKPSAPSNAPLSLKAPSSVEPVKVEPPVINPYSGVELSQDKKEIAENLKLKFKAATTPELKSESKTDIVANKPDTKLTKNVQVTPVPPKQEEKKMVAVIKEKETTSEPLKKTVTKRKAPASTISEDMLKKLPQVENLASNTPEKVINNYANDVKALKLLSVISIGKLKAAVFDLNGVTFTLYEGSTDYGYLEVINSKSISFDGNQIWIYGITP